MEKNLKRQLWNDLEAIQEAVAEEAGMNLPYCPSIDFTAFPYILALLFDEDELTRDVRETLGDETAVLETLRFLAENDRIISRELRYQSLGHIRTWIRSNEDKVLAAIRETIEGYYEEYTGRRYSRAE